MSDWRRRPRILIWLTGLLSAILVVGAPPHLPDTSGTVSIPVQEWPFQPGPRSVSMHLRYPGGTLSGVRPTTGVMLTLHNWGGTGFVGTADPDLLVREFDVIAIGVDYLQSGSDAGLNGPPYDFGYLQALDCLRALHAVLSGLHHRGVTANTGRLYAVGGSGGGNVALMANKLAPRTFACVIDLSGMTRLSDDIAYGLPGGSSLNARYSRNRADASFLTPDRQELHDLGNPAHLGLLRRLGSKTRLICVHGREDTTCPFPDAEAFCTSVRAAGLELDTWFIGPGDLDGSTFTDAGHSLGDRTAIVSRVAGRYLRPDSALALTRNGPSDFERREVLRFPTRNGAYVVDYRDGIPVARFESGGMPP